MNTRQRVRAEVRAQIFAVPNPETGLATRTATAYGLPLFFQVPAGPKGPIKQPKRREINRTLAMARRQAAELRRISRIMGFKIQ